MGAGLYLAFDDIYENLSAPKHSRVRTLVFPPSTLNAAGGGDNSDLSLPPLPHLCQIGHGDDKSVIESDEADEDANVSVPMGKVVAILQVLKELTT